VSLQLFGKFNQLNENKKLSFKLQKILGFRPLRIDYYRIAFIPRSSSIIYHDGSIVNNERLEYLGDAVFDAIIADYLYKTFPGQNEGFLTTMRSKIVNGEYLKKLAIQIGLEEFLQMPPNKNNTSKSIYGDAFEAFIGAVYCDKGYNKTKKFVRKRIIDKHINLDKLQLVENNYKSRIIEWGQKNKKEINFDTYAEEHETEYNPVFVSILKIDEDEAGVGKGPSKKIAEQKAAEIALQQINEE